MSVNQDHASTTSRSLSLRLPKALPWLIAFIAMLPTLALYLAHYLGTPAGQIGTGFVSYDQPYYMADARAYFADGFHWLYGLPFSPFADTPHIYFQPQTLFLGVIWHVTQIDPGALFVAFGIIAGLIAFRLAIALFHRVAGEGGDARTIVLAMFLGGGGFAVMLWMLHHAPGEDLFAFEPSAGWWMPNLGRVAVYSLEAYYHAVFFGTVLLLMARRYGFALIFTALLSASHPFSGLELALTVCAWGGLEFLISRRTAPPFWFLCGAGAVLMAHFAYYMVALGHFSPEHAALQEEWTLPWVRYKSQIIATLGMVGLMAAARLAWPSRFMAAIKDRQFRLLGSWFLVAMALAQHDWFVTPRQPVHFTHAYDWVPLFLIGAPMMVRVVDYLLSRRTLVARLAIAAMLVVAFLDNSIWFARIIERSWAGEAASEEAHDMRMPVTMRDALTELNAPAYADDLIVSDSETLPYYATAYTPLRAWYSHSFNTPYPAQRKAEQAALLQQGADLPAWQGRKMVAAVAVTDTTALAHLDALGYRTTYRNKDFVILTRAPS